MGKVDSGKLQLAPTILHWKIIADLRIENETAKEWQRICEIELADLRKENTGLKRQVKNN